MRAVAGSAPDEMVEAESQHQIGVVDLLEMEAGTVLHQAEEEIVGPGRGMADHLEAGIAAKAVKQNQAVGEGQRGVVAGGIAPAEGM